MNYHSYKETVELPCGKVNMIICHRDGVVKKVMIQVAKNGSCLSIQAVGQAKAINVGLSHGVDPMAFAGALEGLECSGKLTDLEGKTVYASCKDVIAKVLRRFIETHKQEVK